ncbi:MAG TPA: hypothetical protein VK522_24270 [Pseudolabrys sp.]|nr:hypothetical protein [Pseudolabrys sp.]
MDSRIGCQLLTCVAALTFVFGLSTARAQDCSATPSPVAVSGGSVTIDPATAWQAEGGELKVTIKAAKLANDQKIVVCFRWKLQRGDPGPWRNASAIRVIERQGEALKIGATVPAGLTQNAPPLPRYIKPDGPVGVYAVNDSVPVADVRVMLLDSNGAVAVDGLSNVGIVAAAIQCNVPGPQTTADLGRALPSDHKNWQPRGGEVEFTIKSTKANIPADAPVRACFRWKLSNQADPKDFLPSGPVRIIDRQPDSIRIAVTIPNLPPEPPHPLLANNQQNVDAVGTYTGFWLVPQADVRLLVFTTDGSVLVDVWSVIGITFLPMAIIIAVVAILLAFFVLWRICILRLPHLKGTNAILCIVSNRYGYASLSQFQVILWTFLVGGSAVYVMALAGDLIEITTGTLVLLGISGTTTVAAKIKGENDETNTAPTSLPGSASATAAATAAHTSADFAMRAAKATISLRWRKIAILNAESKTYAALADARDKAAKAVMDFERASNDARTKQAAIATAATAADKATAETAAATAADAAKIKEDATMKAVAEANALDIRKPLWSDLVMDEADGREIDVARIQMLYFTLITAGFVLMQVLQSYNIPVIPDSFLILMGISNSVYMGSKFAKPKSQ